jgi:hypothetical protein
VCFGARSQLQLRLYFSFLRRCFGEEI